MKKKIIILILFFGSTIISSGFLCTNYTKYKLIFFYMMTVPSIIGLIICSFLITALNRNDE